MIGLFTLLTFASLLVLSWPPYLLPSLIIFSSISYPNLFLFSFVFFHCIWNFMLWLSIIFSKFKTSYVSKSTFNNVQYGHTILNLVVISPLYFKVLVYFSISTNNQWFDDDSSIWFKYFFNLMVQILPHWIQCRP